MDERGGRQKKSSRARLLRRMEAMALSRANDAVKLAFWDSGLEERIEGMDLSALTELKRSGNGAVEMKFVDRMGALEQLVQLTGGEEGQAEAFFRALDQRAGEQGGA